MEHVNLGYRLNMILSLLEQKNLVPVKELKELLGVSYETIRKDLITLEQNGLISRKHGGAALNRNAVDNLGTPLIHTVESQLARVQIAKEAAKQITTQPHTVVGLDVGNTVLHVARILAERADLTVVTNSLSIVDLYSSLGNDRIYCVGGELRNWDNGLYGDWAIQNLKSVSLSAVVLGTPGLSREGIGALSYYDKDIKRVLVEKAKTCIVVADSSKLERTSFVQAVRWEKIDMLITDSGIKDEDRKAIEEQTNVIVV
jgi:DeoR family transcriptional regulator of aga operon